MLKSVTARFALAAIAYNILGSTFAIADTPRKLDVPAGELTVALQKLAEATDVEFVYSADQLKGVKTRGVRGEYTASEAVASLLEGTKLKPIVHASGALLISERAAGCGFGSAKASEQGVSATDAAVAPDAIEAVGAQRGATALSRERKSFRERLRLAQAGDRSAAAFSSGSRSAAASSEVVEEITVTGTRLFSANLESISPVTTMTRADLVRTGKVRIEDVINQLPQAFASQGANIANGADGTATINLRGLGEKRTLVLVNGRRLMPGDPSGGSAADINQIPLALVKRVEVLTGGAAAVYGADAVAGVVNFIMDTDFDGLMIEGNYSFYDHRNDLNSTAAQAVSARGFLLPQSSVRNGYTKDFTLALGVGGLAERGHATLYAAYREVDAVTQAEYDFSACTLNSGDVFSCGGSSTADPGRFIAVDPNTGFLVTSDTIGSGNILRPFTAADQYNFGPLNHFQRPDERYTAGAFMTFDLSEKLEAYGELMIMDDRSVAQLAPSGAFGSAYRINCDNPFLSPSMVQAWCTNFGLAADDFATVLVGRRNTEGGARQHDLGHESIRLVAGFRGRLNAAWQADAWFERGTTKGDSTTLRDFSISRTQRALQVRDVAGTPTCISVVDGADPQCVPWNIFQLGGVDLDALEYLQVPGFIRAEAVQQIAHVDFTGDLSELLKLPTAETGLALNIGTEYRDEKTEYLPDGVLQAGDLAGQGQAFSPTVGGFNVKEVFAEARLPLLQGNQTLSLEGGYRYSEYSTGFESDTYKAGLEWAPTKALRLRASYQRAARAPNVAELFSAQIVRGDGTVDPCAGILGNASSADDPRASLEQCLRTGMTAAQYGAVPESSGQYNGLIGGNPHVHSERADTVAFGLVFQPSFANLAAVVDYFDIEVDDVITSGSETGGNANLYINSCVATGEPFFCNLIHRDRFGSLWIEPTGYIVDTNLNLGSLATSGIDVQVNYSLDFGGQRLGIDLVGTLLQDLSTQPLPGGDSFDCVGFFGATCGTPKPKWRHLLRVDWQTPFVGLDVSASWRYLGSTELDSSSTDPQLAGEVPLTDAHLQSASYFDLAAALAVGGIYQVRIGVNNVLDKRPPLVGFADCPAPYCNGNTFAQVYDALGRQYFMTLTASF